MHLLNFSRGNSNPVTSVVHFVDRAKALGIRFARCILPHVQRKENGDFQMGGGRFPRIFPMWCGILNARIFRTFHWVQSVNDFRRISMVKIQQRPSRCDDQRGTGPPSHSQGQDATFDQRAFWPGAVAFKKHTNVLSLEVRKLWFQIFKDILEGCVRMTGIVWRRCIVVNNTLWPQWFSRCFQALYLDADKDVKRAQRASTQPDARTSGIVKRKSLLYQMT